MSGLQQIALHCCVVLCFIPSYLWYTRRILTGGESALSACLIPLVLWFACNTKDKDKPRNTFTIVGMLLYTLGWLLHLPAIIKASIAIATLLNHFGLIRKLPIVSLSFLTLPWLDSLQFYLGYPLRRVVAEVSALGLNSLNLDVTAIGTGLLYQNHHVFVDPPCSGIKMLWAGTILCSILITLSKLNWKTGVSLHLTTWLLLLVANSVRGMLLFFPEAQLVHWHEWTHEGIGMAIYALCTFGLITLSQKLAPRRA